MKQVYEDPYMTITELNCSDIVICSLTDKAVDDNYSDTGNFGDVVRPSQP